MSPMTTQDSQAYMCTFRYTTSTLGLEAGALSALVREAGEDLGEPVTKGYQDPGKSCQIWQCHMDGCEHGSKSDWRLATRS